MKSKTVFKILLDFVMTILYVLLLFFPSANSFFHEAVGIGIGLLFVLHIVINRKPIKVLLKSTVAGNIKNKSTVRLTVDLLLTAGMFTVIITGILISEVLFYINTGTGWMLIYQIHNVASYVCLGILGIHLLLHAKYLVILIKQMYIRRKESNVKKVMGRFIAASFAVGILYLVVLSSYKNNNSIKTSYESSENDTSSTVEITENLQEKNSKVSSIASSSTYDANSAISLIDYLSKLFCTGCHNHCPLSSPKCNKSAEQIKEATVDYNEEYSIG